MSGILEKNVKHNESKDWIQKVAEEMQGKKQHNIKITPTKPKKRIHKLGNWKATGFDGVNCYSIKKFTSIHGWKAFHLKGFVATNEVLDWMTTVRTILLMKEKGKGNEVSSYEAITCLTLMWKLYICIVVDETYKRLEENDLLPEERKTVTEIVDARRNSF